MNEETSEHEIAAEGNVREHSTKFMKETNVMGIGVGHKIAEKSSTGETCVTIYVTKKIPKKYIPDSQMIPKVLKSGVRETRTDVVEIGPIYALGLNTIKERPIRPGTSLGHPEISAGTLGALLLDSHNSDPVILSNNHILANLNTASIGDNILQPGPADGGTEPEDAIGKLLRFIPLNFDGGFNSVDAAICSLSDPGLVQNIPHNVIPYATAENPAVGLLFAGSFSHTIINPIESVLNLLNIKFPDEGVTVVPKIGMNVQKTGRTTGATFNSIKGVNATLKIGYGEGKVAVFENQIVAGPMSFGGDSGSLVVRGGGGIKGCLGVVEKEDIDELSANYLEVDSMAQGCHFVPGGIGVTQTFTTGGLLGGVLGGIGSAGGSLSGAIGFWAQGMEFRDSHLAESGGGRRLTRLVYASLKRINQVLDQDYEDEENSATIQSAERIIPFFQSTFVDPSSPELTITAQNVSDFRTMVSSIDEDDTLTDREKIGLQAAAQMFEDAEGKTMADIMILLEDKEYMESIPVGSKYVGNKNSKEVHDLDNMTSQCQVEKIIKASNAIFFDTGCLASDDKALELIHAEGYDNCHYCIGDSKR